MKTFIIKSPSLTKDLEITCDYIRSFYGTKFYKTNAGNKDEMVAFIPDNCIVVEQNAITDK